MKTGIISLNYKNLSDILENSAVKEAMRRAVEADFSESTTVALRFEIMSRTLKASPNNININVELAKGGRSRKASVDKQLKVLEGVNMDDLNMLNNMIVETRSVLFNIPREALSKVKMHDKSEFTKLVTLYRELEESYPAFHDKGFIKNREDFYDKYLRIVLRPNNYSINRLYAFAAKSHAISSLVEQQKAYNDSERSLTVYMIRMFVKHTKRSDTEVNRFIQDPALYYKFMSGMNCLNNMVKERAKDGSILLFTHLTETKKKKYIDDWVSIHCDAYSQLNGTLRDELVELGYLAGSHADSYSNAERRFRNYYQNKGRKAEPKKLSNKKLSDWK